MLVEFLKSFSSDLDDLKIKSSKQILQSIILQLEKAESIQNIPQLA